MKYLVLLLYTAVAYFAIPYIFLYLGALKQVGSLSDEAINAKKEIPLQSAEASLFRKLGNVSFLVFSIYLYALLSITFGLVCQECFSLTTCIWTAYILFYLGILSGFNNSRLVMKRAYRVTFSIPECLFFQSILLTAYILALWNKDFLPTICCWHWIY